MPQICAQVYERTSADNQAVSTSPTAFSTGTTNYVIPVLYNQFCLTSLPYITAATTLLTTVATTFYAIMHYKNSLSYFNYYPLKSI